MPDTALISLLRCPESLQPLRWASSEQLSRSPVALDAALVREDGALLYPVRDGIPILLSEEAIHLAPAGS